MAGVPCAGCHPSYPHAEDWLDTHGAPVSVAGDGPCMGCHDPGDGAASLVARCTTACHGEAP